MPNIGPSVRLGRLPRDTLGNVESITYDGDNITMRGRTPAVDPTELPWRREQLLGLNQSLDSLVIPVTCGDDPSLDGYYTDIRSGVDYDGGNLELGHLRWSLSARRVPGRDAPGMEIIQLGGHRSNAISFSAASSEPWHGVPATVSNYYTGVAAGHTFTYTRPTATGESIGIGVYATTGIARRVASFTLAPADFYHGAATVSVSGAVVTGRQVPSTNAALNSWSIGNGLVEVSGATTSGYLKVRSYIASAWHTHEYRLRFDSASLTIDTWTTFTVLRNTPEVCVVRLGARSGTNLHRHAIDITIRRGARVAEIMWRTDDALLGEVSIQPGTTAETRTGGLRFDGATPKWLMLSPSTITKDTGAGMIYLTTQANRFSFGLAAAVGSESSTDNLTSQYFGSLECWQQVVGR